MRPASAGRPHNHPSLDSGTRLPMAKPNYAFEKRQKELAKKKKKEEKRLKRSGVADEPSPEEQPSPAGDSETPAGDDPQAAG